MNCKNCGNPLKEGQNFCSACGCKVEKEEVQEIVEESVQEPVQQQTVQQPVAQAQVNTQQPVNVAHSEGLGTASMIIGIISLILTFLVSFFILPLAIIGLILGIVNKAKKGKKISGIILNAIAIVINVGILLVTVILVGLFTSAVKDGYNGEKGKEFLNDLYTELDYSSNENFVVGKYNCSDVVGDLSNYLITIHLNEDKTFFYGPYGKTENNYAKGTYTFEDEHKTNKTGNYKYFMVTFTGNKEDFIVNGKPSDKGFNSKMELGLTTSGGKKEGVAMFVSTYNTYYCYEE